jgi:hypothetical protein
MVDEGVGVDEAEEDLEAIIEAAEELQVSSGSLSASAKADAISNFALFFLRVE